MEQKPKYVMPGEVEMFRQNLRSGIEGYAIGSYDSGRTELDEMTPPALADRTSYLASLVGISPTSWRRQFVSMQTDEEVIERVSKTGIASWPGLRFGQFVHAVGVASLEDNETLMETIHRRTIAMRSGIGWVAIGTTAKYWNMCVDTTNRRNAPNPQKPKTPQLEKLFSVGIDLSFYPQQ